MARGTYFTTCPSCGAEVEAELSVSPEQQGGPETEYLPEHWELDALFCDCGYEFKLTEARALLDAARRELGR